MVWKRYQWSKHSILDFRSEELYPLTFLTASILQQLWTSRVEKITCAWPSIRAQVEPQILLLRTGRLAHFADIVHLMLDATSPIVAKTQFDFVNCVKIEINIIILPKPGSYFPFPIWKKNSIFFLIIKSNKVLTNSNKTRSLTLAQPSLFLIVIINSFPNTMMYYKCMQMFQVWWRLSWINIVYTPCSADYSIIASYTSYP